MKYSRLLWTAFFSLALTAVVKGSAAGICNYNGNTVPIVAGVLSFVLWTAIDLYFENLKDSNDKV